MRQQRVKLAVTPTSPLCLLNPNKLNSLAFFDSFTLVSGPKTDNVDWAVSCELRTEALLGVGCQ